MLEIHLEDITVKYESNMLSRLARNEENGFSVFDPYSSLDHCQY